MLDSLIQKICTANGWHYDHGRAQLPLDGGRTQDIEFQTFTADGEEFVRLFSVIGPSAALDERRLMAVLRLNASMRLGAFAIVGDNLAVVDTFLVREADHYEVRHSLEYLAKTADRYEQVVFGTDDN
jgi:hypothetical protein